MPILRRRRGNGERSEVRCSQKARQLGAEQAPLILEAPRRRSGCGERSELRQSREHHGRAEGSASASGASFATPNVPQHNIIDCILTNHSALTKTIKTQEPTVDGNNLACWKERSVVGERLLCWLVEDQRGPLTPKLQCWLLASGQFRTCKIFSIRMGGLNTHMQQC